MNLLIKSTKNLSNNTFLGKLMQTQHKVIIASVLIATMALFVVVEAMQDAYAPRSRRWPVMTGMELPMVTILDENGYYATLSCTVTGFNDKGDNKATHTFDMNCQYAPEVITVGK